MAKREKVELKKAEAKFILIGNAIISDYTFTIDTESKNSDWIYNQLKLGVETPSSGVIFAEMMGGYGSGRENKVYVHGKKQNEANQTVDDYKNRFQIDWDDRLYESMFEEVGDSCFFTVGIEKTDKDKTYYKKFLSEYDAILYVKEHLTQNMVIRVSGDLIYRNYEDRTQCKKAIRSIVLSNLPPEKHGAFFSQAILVDSDSVEKLDKDKMTYGINGYVVDYVGKYKDGKKSIDIKTNAVFPRRFEMEHVDDVKTPKALRMMFGAKKDEVWEIVAEGIITNSATMMTATIDYLPEDIKELIEVGVMTEEEALERCAVKGNKVETFIIKRPRIKRSKDETVLPTVDINKEKYQRDDYVTYNNLLVQHGEKSESTEEQIEDDEEDIDFDSLMED